MFNDPQLEVIVISLIEKHGFTLPEGITYEGDTRMWTLAGAVIQPQLMHLVYSCCAMTFFKQIQGRKPVLDTNSHGDWMLEIRGIVDHPCVHWDQEPYSMILRGILAWKEEG